jgi:hypothetical protein
VVNNKQITGAQETMQKRSRSKFLTNAIVYKLAELDTPLKTSYWNAYHCSNVVQQQGDKIKAKYCNTRWCITCNRIRTAKLINGYKSQLLEFSEPQFVTLSAKNIKADQLPERIKEYNNAFTRIRKNIKKSYNKEIKGIRKLEVTYNPRRDDYHPHYHLIIDGKETAETVVKLWLNQFKEQADIKAQDIRPAGPDSLTELFKYVVKMQAKGARGIKALDTIFQALKGKRLTASYGIKYIKEDVNPEMAKRCDWKRPGNYVYLYNSGQVDWIRGDGDKLSGYKIDEKTEKTAKNILRGHIDLEQTPAELEQDTKQLKGKEWQRNELSYSRELLELIQKQFERDNPQPFKPKEQKRATNNQLNLFL